MNIAKRLLNVVAILGWILTAGGIFIDLLEGSNKAAIYYGLFLLGLVLTINYILFHNISVWNKGDKA